MILYDGYPVRIWAGEQEYVFSQEDWEKHSLEILHQLQAVSLGLSD